MPKPKVCKAAGFKVVVDCINSVGGVALPPLFEALGVQEVTLINGEPTGSFAHNPEPHLPHHLTELAEQGAKAWCIGRLWWTFAM